VVLVRGVREIGLLLVALALFPLASLLIGSDASGPIARGEAVVELERSLGIFVEPAVHDWATARPDLLLWAGVFYIWAHVPVAGWALVWTWYLRRDAYPTVRNLFLATQALTIALYLAVPTAPPRLLPDGGFADTLTGLWGRELADSAHLLQSPYAAMPSGHMAFALIAGGTFAVLGDQRWLRAFGWLYPPLVALVTLVTANHYVLDLVAAGAVVAAALYLVTSRPWQGASSSTSPRTASGGSPSRTPASATRSITRSSTAWPARWPRPTRRSPAA
jgi:hypothetical protein